MFVAQIVMAGIMHISQVLPPGPALLLNMPMGILALCFYLPRWCTASPLLLEGAVHGIVFSPQAAFEIVARVANSVV